MPAPTWKHGNVEEGRLATGKRFARFAAGASTDLPFVSKMILLTANTAVTVTMVDGTTFAFLSGELAPNVWHPCVCQAITANTADVLIQE